MRDDFDDPLRLLGEVPAFAALPDPVLACLAASGESRELPSGTVLFEQGRRPEHLHVLLTGQVGLLGASTEGQTTVVEVLQPVDQFVLAAVLTDAPYLMSARTLSDARLYLIDAASLRTVIKSEPELAVAMMTSLARHYRMMVRQVKDLKLRSTAQRIGCFLLQLARDQPGGPLRRPYGNQVLAARLGRPPRQAP